MHSITAVVVASALAFIGTMIDEFFAFTAQLSVTPDTSFRRVCEAQATGVGELVIVAYGVAAVLAPIPLAWTGLFAVATWALGLYRGRHRNDPVHERFSRGAATTFVLTVTLGGDNLAVWIVMIRSQISSHAVVTLLTFAILEGLFIVASRATARRPSFLKWRGHHARGIVAWVYFALGFLIVIESLAG